MNARAAGNRRQPIIHLVSHGKTPPEAVTAAARQLAGFTWAEMTP
jgi:hypothetical protein